MPTFELSDGTGRYHVTADTEDAALAAFQGMSAPVQPDAPKSTNFMDAAADVAGSIQGGVIRGAAALPGLPGSIAGLTQFMGDQAARQTVGRLYNRFAPGGTGTWEADERQRQPRWYDKLSATNVLPSSEDTIKATEGVIGQTYRPQTTPGQYAATAAEFAGSGGRLLPSLVAGAASEGAGQLAAGTAAEAPARLAAALAAPLAAGKVISPVRADPSRAALVSALRNEGVDLTAGQVTGSRPLRFAESALSEVPGGGGGAARFAEQQSQQFNQAVAKRIGETADNLGPDTISRASKRIGDQFDTLSARNTLQADQQFVNDLSSAAQTYDRVLGSEQRQKFGMLLQDITGKFSGGQMPGVEYQLARSRLSRIAENNRMADPDYAEAVRGLRNALDSGMGRSITPSDASAWQTARREYANLKTIEKAITGAGEGAALGNVSPLQLRTAVANRDRSAYSRGEGDFAELARAGAAILQPMPNSGTAPRMAVTGAVSGLGGAGAHTGSPTLLGAAGAAAVAPALAGRLLMSRPGQAWAGNQAMAGGGDDARQALVRALMSYELEPRRAR